MPTNHDKIFTAHEVMALQEDILKHVKVMGEQLSQTVEDVAFIKGKMEVLDDLAIDMRLVKTDIREILDKKADKKEVQKVQDRVGVLERKFLPA